MKEHEENPQDWLVPPNGGEEEGVVDSPKPFRSFFRKDLQCRRVLGLPEDFDESYSRSNKKDGKRDVDHGDQYDIVDSLH